MTRSIAASMGSSGMSSGGDSADKRFSSDKLFSFEFGNREIGEPDLVGFAAMIELNNDGQQAIVGREIIGDGAAPAQKVCGDGVGIAHYPGIHYPHAALDQHGDHPSLQTDNFLRVELVPVTAAFLCRRPKSIGAPEAKPSDAPRGRFNQTGELKGRAGLLERAGLSPKSS